MKQTAPKETIELTSKQFETLLKVVYLGNWMANAHRTDDMKKDYESIEDYIFSLAPQFGFKKYMDHDDADGEKYYPTRLFEEQTDVDKLHEEYDEETFWDELIHRLAERDFYEQYPEKVIKKMSREERFVLLSRFVEAYCQEMEEFGLERLRVEQKDQV